MVKVTTDLDLSLQSTNSVFFGTRLLKDEAVQGMYILAGMTDWELSKERDSDSVSYSSVWNGVNAETTAVTSSGSEVVYSGTYNLVMSNAGQDLLSLAYDSQEVVQLLEIQGDRQADGKTILDDEGNVVPEGYMYDTYVEGKVTSWDKSGSRGDGYITVEFEITVNGTPQNSWVKVDPADNRESATQYTNKGVGIYTAKDLGGAELTEYNGGWDHTEPTPSNKTQIYTNGSTPEDKSAKHISVDDVTSNSAKITGKA